MFSGKIFLRRFFCCRLFFIFINCKRGNSIIIIFYDCESFPTKITYHHIKKNMVGFASVALLSSDIDDLFLMKCICHSFHLCASYACKKLPNYIEDFARRIFNYFHCSPRHRNDFKEFQEFCQLKPYKLLQPNQTRWLSLPKVVDRLLDALKLYFSKAATYDAIQFAVNIHTMLENPCIKLYLDFLQFVLPIFHDMNCKMQCEKPKIHLLYDRIRSLYLQLLSCYINKKYLDTTAETEIQYIEIRKIIFQQRIFILVEK